MSGSSADTAQDVDSIQFERYAQMSPADKMARVVDLTRTACLLSLGGLRARHPAADERELLLRLAVLRLGAETVGRAYGWPASPAPSTPDGA